VEILIDLFNGTSTQKGPFVPTVGRETGTGCSTKYNALHNT